MKQIQYNFQYITNCNMCNTAISKCKILGKRLNQSQGIRPQKKIGITTTIMKCKQCGLTFSNPLPVPESINNQYDSTEYWEPKHFKIYPNYFKREIKILHKLLNTKSDKRVKALDIGAGLGNTMLSLEQEGIDAYGIEPSKAFYEYAINKIGINKKKIKNLAIEEAEFKINQFDFISLHTVLEHVYNPSEAIKKALKWLKPNGIMRIEVPSSKWLMDKIINFFYKLQGLEYVTNISPMNSPFHLYEFGLKSFQKHAKKNNYKIIYYTYMTGGVLHVPKIIHPLIKFIMDKTNTGVHLEIWLRKT